MADIELLSIIHKLERWQVDLPDCIRSPILGTTYELRMILDFLRGNKLEVRRRLNYFICDAIEIGHDALNPERYNQLSDFNFLYKIHDYARNTKKYMLQFKQSPIRSENIGKGDDEDAVGIDKEVKLLLRREILVDSQSFQALLITGMSGVGKTTLARQIYNHADVIDRFERRAWVCVSDLSSKEILMKLIQQVVHSEQLQTDFFFEKMDNEDLQQMLHQQLQGIHYFIVLDDLPKDMYLDSILKALPHEDQQNCRLLFTSCTKKTEWLEINSCPSFHYVVKALDSNKSWQLFLKTIFLGNECTSEDTFPKQLEKKGREVLMKTCEGLPLAIKEVGRQFAEKRLSGCEWEDLFQSIDLDSTLELLEPTYHKLDPEEKLSFLHLAFFKDNTAIRLNKFRHISDATRIASRQRFPYHLCRLERESIIEVKYQEEFNETKSYHMNVILHMLSVKKAKEEIGFEILSNDGKIQLSQSPRHRAICCSREKLSNYSTNQDKHLVSLLFRGGGCFNSSPSYWKSLEELRILDFEDFGLKVLPESISNMPELRYLGLRNNYIQDIPNSLGRLIKLEVLDIVQNFMVEVPNIIWEMDSLRYLYMSDVICRMPLKMDTLRNLDTLTYISVENWTYEIYVQIFPDIIRVRFYKLGIENFVDGNSDARKLFASLAELGYLRHLILRGSRCRSMPSLVEVGILHGLTILRLDGLLAELPSAHDFPPNLKTLKLVNSCLYEDPMPVLEKLPNLMRLKLRNAYTGQQMAIVMLGGFCCLEYLCIEELWNLRKVEMGKGALPLIQKLEINNCPHLETLPKDIGSLDKLVELKMVTTKRIATKIRNSGSIPNIKHVDIGP